MLLGALVVCSLLVRHPQPLFASLMGLPKVAGCRCITSRFFMTNLYCPYLTPALQYHHRFCVIVAKVSLFSPSSPGSVGED